MANIFDGTTASGQMFRIANLVAGSLMASGGLLLLFDFSLRSLIFAVYALGAGVLAVLLEFIVIPAVPKYANLFYSFLGRGLLYILASNFFFAAKHVFRNMLAFALFVIGVAYCALEFVSNVEVPSNMREPFDDSNMEQI